MAPGTRGMRVQHKQHLASAKVAWFRHVYLLSRACDPVTLLRRAVLFWENHSTPFRTRLRRHLHLSHLGGGAGVLCTPCLSRVCSVTQSKPAARPRLLSILIPSEHLRQLLSYWKHARCQRAKGAPELRRALPPCPPILPFLL